MKELNAMEAAFKKAVEESTKKDKDFIKEKMFGKQEQVTNKKNKITNNTNK